MLDPLNAALVIAGSGLRAQSSRMQIVTENLANAGATASTPGGDPYVRKTITFGNEFDRAAGVSLMKAGTRSQDSSPFRIEYNPGHPAADSKGFVKLPNVDVMIEMADMREANRSYQASLQAFKQSRELITMTLDLLKA